MSMEKPSTFRALGLPPGIFGEAYVVISVWQPSATSWMGEYNILTKRPHEHLFSDVVPFDTVGYPVELQPIDATYMEAEAILQAETHLILELEERASDAQFPELAYLPVKLERTNISPVTLWVRNMFPAKFEDMANETESPALKSYLRVVMSLPKLTPG
jgi:hypothetical protein